MTRCPGPTYQDILDRDAAAPPPILRESASDPLGEDQAIMPRVQRGLRTTRKKGVSLGLYQESRIRHFRKTLEEYVPR